MGRPFVSRERDAPSTQHDEFYAESNPVWMSKRDRIFLLQLADGKPNRDHRVWAQTMLARFDQGIAIGLGRTIRDDEPA